MGATEGEHADGLDLAAAIDELYQLDPADFTGRRDAIAADARRRGDKDLASAVKKLRRPSAAAHVANVLARRRPEEVERLTRLGLQLRQAQEALSADELRALGRQRSQLVVSMARQAIGLTGGRRPSEAVRRDLEATLEAALADPAAAAALASGRLVRGLEHRGLDPVDLEGAVVGDTVGRRPATRPVTRSPAGGHSSGGPGVGDADGLDGRARRRAEAALEEAREAAEAAAAARDEAQRAREQAECHHQAARTRREEADQRVADLQQELARAREAADAAASGERRARRDLDDAVSEAEAAGRAWDRAQAALEEAGQALDQMGGPPG